MRNSKLRTVVPMLEKLLQKTKTALVVGSAIASMAVAGNVMSQVRSVDGRASSHNVTATKTLKVKKSSVPLRELSTTLIAIPEYDVKDGYNTRLEVMNGLVENVNILAVGREGQLGKTQRAINFDMQSRGSFKDWVSTLFGSYGQSADKIDLRIPFDNAERKDQTQYYKSASLHNNAEEFFGKLTSTLRIVGPSDSTESAFSFNSTQRPMHELSFPYRPQDASLTEVVLSNEFYDDIDVYLRDEQGQEFLLKENLGFHGQTTFDFSGFNDITHGDIVAYRAGTSLLVDGLVGTMKFRYDDDYKRAEGYALRGASVDGTSSFSSEFYMPLAVIEQMSALNIDTDGWEKFVYRNVTDSEQTVTAEHFLLDGTLADTVEFNVLAGEQISEDTSWLGFDGEGMVNFSVKDKVTGEASLGDMVYFVGDEPDNVMGSSVLAGGLVPSNQNKSKYLRFGLVNDGDTRQVFAIHNPGDIETILNFTALSRLGSAIADNLPASISIPAHGTVFYNSQDAIGLGFDGSSLSGANHGLVGVVLNYSTTPVKDQLSASGTIIEAVNEPGSKYEINSIDVEGQVNSSDSVAFLNQITGIIVDYNTIGGTQRIDRLDMLVDGVKVAEYNEPTNMFQGEVGFNYEFMETGMHKVTFRAYADDGNKIFDTKRSIDVNVSEHAVVASLEYFDVNHNPTDTLKVNEPFYVKYNVERFDGGDIGEIFFKLSPSDGLTDDDFRLNGLSGTLVEGERYIESGIGVAQSDINGQATLNITPKVDVYSTQGAQSHSGVEGDYQLPPERVYESIATGQEFRDWVADNIYGIDDDSSDISKWGLAKCLSEGNNNTYENMANALSQISQDTNIKTGQNNDYQNIYYFICQDNSQFGLELGEQTYLAEQLVDRINNL